MILLTDIISKQVLCLSHANTLGTVENAIFDRKLEKMTYLCLFDEESCEKKYIAVSNIISAQNSTITVKKPSFYQGEITPNSPLKAEIFDPEGKKLGVICDIALSDDFKIMHLINESGKIIKPQEIITFSSSAAVYCENGKKPQYLSSMPRQKSKTSTVKREENCEKTVNPPSHIPIQLINIVPPYNYLIGRKTLKDIYDGNKKLIIKKDSIVTLSTVDSCRKHNKLMTLAKNSKK